MNQLDKNRKHHGNRHDIIIAVFLLLFAGMITVIMDV